MEMINYSAKDFIDLNRDGKQDIKNRGKLIDLKNRIQDLIPGNVHQYNTTWTDDGITLGGYNIVRLCLIDTGFSLKHSD